MSELKGSDLIPRLYKESRPWFFLKARSKLSVRPIKRFCVTMCTQNCGPEIFDIIRNPRHASGRIGKLKTERKKVSNRDNQWALCSVETCVDRVIIQMLRGTNKADTEKAFAYLYETNYVRVRQSISKYRSEEAVAVDIFEDALLVFKKHALSGKFECFTVNKQRASISTYLVNVMNKLWLKQMTKDKRLKRLRSEYENDGMVLTLESLKEIDNQIEEYEAAKLIQEEIEKLDDNAKEILTRYLVHGEEAESIHPDYVERYQRIDSLRVFISRKVAKLKDSIKQLLDR